MPVEPPHTSPDRLHHDRIAYQRPPAWKGALIVLGMILVMSVLYGAVTGALP